jgi:hypothetical protein
MAGSVEHNNTTALQRIWENNEFVGGVVGGVRLGSLAQVGVKLIAFYQTCLGR